MVVIAAKTLSNQMAELQQIKLMPGLLWE